MDDESEKSRMNHHFLKISILFSLLFNFSAAFAASPDFAAEVEYEATDFQAPVYKPQPLAWELAKPAISDEKKWSTYLYSVIAKESALLEGSSDVTTFCPNYHSLSKNQKINFWGMLLSGVAKYESGFNPLERYLETTLGNDPITGLPVESEGLLQLSYQDIRDYPFCQFDWSKDKKLSPKDPRKTTLNPYTNLACGAGIMNRQIASQGNIVLHRGERVYWSSLESGSSHSQVTNIRKITKSLSFCN